MKIMKKMRMGLNLVNGGFVNFTSAKIDKEQKFCYFYLDKEESTKYPLSEISKSDLKLFFGL